MFLLEIISGGVYPVSAAFTNHIMNVIKQGQHGSTFGGNPYCSIRFAMQLRVVQERRFSAKTLLIWVKYCEQVCKLLQ
jgi:ornithine--oxo-acid transaminase